MVPASDPVTIKLDAQRRLREPRTGSCVTMADLAARVRRGTPIVIADAHCGADVTAFVLSSHQTEH